MGRMRAWIKLNPLNLFQAPHLTRDASLRSQRTPSSPVPGEEQVSINADWYNPSPQGMGIRSETVAPPVVNFRVTAKLFRDCRGEGRPRVGAELVAAPHHDGNAAFCGFILIRADTDLFLSRYGRGWPSMRSEARIEGQVRGLRQTQRVEQVPSPSSAPSGAPSPVWYYIVAYPR